MKNPLNTPLKKIIYVVALLIASLIITEYALKTKTKRNELTPEVKI